MSIRHKSQYKQLMDGLSRQHVGDFAMFQLGSNDDRCTGKHKVFIGTYCWYRPDGRCLLVPPSPAVCTWKHIISYVLSTSRTAEGVAEGGWGTTLPLGARESAWRQGEGVLGDKGGVE